MKRRAFLSSMVAFAAAPLVPLSSRFVDTTEQLVFDSGEVQVVGGTGGTFTLTVDGMTTRAIQFGAPQQALDDALRDIGAPPGSATFGSPGRKN